MTDFEDLNIESFDIERFANEMVLKEPPIPLLADGQEAPFFIKTIEAMLIEAKQRKMLLLPNLHNHIESVGAFSDYSGEGPQEKFATYSFTFVGLNALFYFFEKQKKIRERHGLNEPYKEIEFKELRYGPLKRALPELLKAAELIPGLLFTMVVNKSIMSIIGENNKNGLNEITTILKDHDLGEWKNETAEKLMRIVHTVAYWLTVLTKDGQKVFWMTDDDSIAANEKKKDALGNLLFRLLGLYSNSRQFPTIGYATPFDQKNNLNDLLSISDLVAGSISSYFSAIHTQEDPMIKDTSDKILIWLCNQGLGLKRLTMLFDLDSCGAVKGSILKFSPKNENLEAEFIPIYL